jgi:hypothetical protein
MRTWLVLAAVLAVAAAAAADALRGGLRNQFQAASPPAERRIVPPGAPAGVMGTVYYSDPDDGCRLHTLQLAGFEDARAPNDRACRFSLSPDGKTVAPEGTVWSPLGGLVAVPRQAGFPLETDPAAHTIFVRGRAPAFKPDGDLTYVHSGALLEWSDCTVGARTCRPLFAGRVMSAAWFSDTRFAAVLPSGRLVIVEGRRVLVRANLPHFQTVSLELSPKRSFATLWLDGELAGTFDSGGGPAPIAPIGAVTALAWAPSERWIVAATREGAVFLLRPDAGDARVRRLAISARDLAWR